MIFSRQFKNTTIYYIYFHFLLFPIFFAQECNKEPCKCDGIKGALGSQGPAGVRGQEGDPGEVGYDGPPGRPGEIGEYGEIGSHGEKGYRVCKFQTTLDVMQ